VTGLVRDALTGFDWFVLAYFVALNSGYLGLLALAALDLTRTLRSEPFAAHDDTFANPMTPGVSVIVPAYNEEVGIVESVRALLGLRYPAFEVIVVDDGSTDATFELLRRSFSLQPVDRAVSDEVPTLGAVREVHASSVGEPLVVVRKGNAGRRSDALNAGINAARMPLVCMIDADSILDEEALLRVVKPFVDDPERVVATGGVIRAANGSRIERGRVVDVRMPRQWLARIQVVEYLRAFLFGRTGWSRLGGLLIISGAFGLFRRDLVVSLGGLDLDCIGEDCELVTRIHHHMRAAGRRDYRLVFISEPVCWTEVPGTRAVLGRQRTRWSRGLAQVLRRHRTMIGNPRYGRIGLVVLPYYLVFELLGPVVELTGFTLVLLGLPLGLLNPSFALLFALFALGYGVLLSLASLALEEFSYHRYPRWRDLGIAIVAAFLENVGYRQLHAWWRLRGLVAELRGSVVSWGEMPRQGLASSQ
jgi:cellulose synthase/poly-beta-1,6-N-acetylglucosamine synthase-like glycosyltransferase